MPNVNEKASKSATNTSAAYIESFRDTALKSSTANLMKTMTMQNFGAGGKEGALWKMWNWRLEHMSGRTHILLVLDLKIYLIFTL